MAVLTTSQKLLGKNLKQLRSLLDLSQAKLAERCELSTNFVNELENGKVWISAETLDRICVALKVDQYRLFLPDDRPEVQTDITLGAFYKDFEEVIKAALDKLREKYLTKNI